MDDRILIVDDDSVFSEALYAGLSSRFGVEKVDSVAGFREAYRPCAFQLVVLDMRLERDRDGIELLGEIMEADPYQLVIVVTKYADTETHIAAIEAGAQLYLNKDGFPIPFIVQMIGVVLQQGHLRRRVATLERRLDEVDSAHMVGESEKLRDLYEKARLAAEDGEVTVLIRGESGTGKELVARNIHRLSHRRKDGPFVAISVSGLHRETIHSDLFGHERGAFTGANTQRKGFIEEAHGGVLFLDEIGDLDRDTQVKLLRVLEERTFQRLGSNREISADFQLVTATHRDLRGLIDEGAFRHDLYYRLQAFEIRVPSIKERRRDIVLLAEYFLAEMANAGRTTAAGFHRRALEVFIRYDWPGNVRELKNAVEYSAIQAKMRNEPLIVVEHLPQTLTAAELATVNQSGEAQNMDYRQWLARSELELLERVLETSDKTTKTELAAVLGYNDRFTLMRRIKKAVGICRGQLDALPNVRQLLGA